jgi:uncharacterized membrane protein
MHNLLTRLLIKCPNARIVVTGYYPIVSDKSKGLTDTIEALYPESQQVNDYQRMDEPHQRDQLRDKSNVFYTESTMSIKAAVNEANSDSGDNRVAFAQIEFSPDNCYGADQSLLWKIGNYGGQLKTDDNRFDIRMSILNDLGWVCACEQCSTSPGAEITQDVDCNLYRRNKFVAVGHPNEKGAIKYKDSIIETIGNSWPNWPDWQNPTVLAFDVLPRSVTSGESLEITYTVSDNGGSGLRQVELWRTQEKDKWPEDPIQTTVLADENGPSGSFTDTPTAPGKYWYGVHVVDNAGNWNDEGNSSTNGQPSSFEPAEVEVVGSTMPIVQAFQVTPQSLNLGEPFAIDYTVSGSDGSGLKQVELWRKDETSDWQQISTNALAGETGPLPGSFTDTPTAPGKYWYGVHVVDKAGNWNDERNSNTEGQPSGLEPVEVVVSATEKTSQAHTTQDSVQAVPSEFILFAGTPLKLNDGYELALESLDIDGNKIYLELSKDGQIVDSSSIRPHNDIVATYSYTKNKTQVGSEPVIKVHFRNSFRGQDQTFATIDSIWQASESDHSRILLDNNNSFIFSTLAPLRLEEGYELVLRAADIDGNKVYVELNKDGQMVNSSVIIPSNEFDEAYKYTKDKEQADDAQIILVHFKNAFRGSDNSFATIDDVWQVSETDHTNVIRESTEEISLTSVEPLALEEGYELALKSIDIDGNKVYVELSKDGQVVDSSIILPFGSQEIQIIDPLETKFQDGSDGSDGSYEYINGIEKVGAVPVIKAHFRNAFRGADQTHTTVDSIWQVSELDHSRVLLDSNDTRILAIGETIRLEEGYELVFKSIDIDGNNVYVELSRDGQVVESSVIRTSDEFEDSYTYTVDDRLGETVPVIEVHFKNSFRGTDIDIATIDRVWQASGLEPVEAEGTEIKSIETPVATSSNEAGKILWSNTFNCGRTFFYGLGGIDSGESVQQTNDGGYIIVGHAQAGYYESKNVFLIKTDPNGNVIWNKTLEGSWGKYVQQTNDGGYIITGDSGDSYKRVLLIKTDDSGNEVWRNVLDGYKATSVQQSEDGGYIIMGFLRTLISIYGDRINLLLIKTDSEGNQQWYKVFNSSERNMTWLVLFS